MRLSREELQKKIESNGCKYSLSWSKLNTFVEDPFSFKLNYLDHIKQEKQNSYAFLGDIVHNGLEAFYKDEKTMEQVIDEFEKKVAEQSVSNINFVKDEEKNNKIEQNYYSCIKHFFKNYQKKSPHSKLEVFVGWKFGDYFMQGYVDHMYPEVEVEYEEIDGEQKIKSAITKLVIEDFKTSTLYSGEKISQNSGQLKLYAYMAHKMQNIPIDQIKIGWNFLKYVNVDIVQKNGKIKTSKILRNELPEKLLSKLKTWSKHFGYDEDQTEHFYNILKINSSQYKDVNIFDGIPQEIADKFKIYDCFVNIELNEEILNNFVKYIEDKIDEMSSKIELYKLTKDDNLFWKEVTKENSFFFLNLCGYTARHHKPLKKYLDTLSSFEDKSVEINDDILNFLFNE